MAQTGLSAGNLGVVGDAAHAIRATYHNGRDRFLASGLDTCAENYTICTGRDRAGLTNAAAAIDIGNHGGLRALSRWLVGRARSNAPGTRDIREIIYSPDGRQVLRWDRERGIESLPKTGEADDTHRWHTHVSFYRDSELRDKVGIFRPYYEPLVPSEQPVYMAKIDGATQTYNSRNEERGEISGLTVGVAERIKIEDLWRYRIVPPYKYAGRYLPANPTVTYDKIGD
jgi:hypothetical protein